MSDQLGLFGDEPPDAPVGPAEQDEELRALGAGLPARLRLGTSSWSFPGWAGVVYDRAVSETVLARHGLRAYARHPLFGTVGVDRGYYRPVPLETWQRYARAVPAGFRFLAKAHQDVTLPRFPNQPRHGARAGQPNPLFLDAAYLREAVLEPMQGGLGAKAGVLLVQLSAMNLSALDGPQGVVRRLDTFFAALRAGGPVDVVLALEVRNEGLLTPDYAACLADHGVAPCLTGHAAMPSVAEQVERLGACYGSAPALVARWMLKPGLAYEAARARYAPFDALVDPDPETRACLAELLAEELLDGEARRDAYVIVNNKAEGSSPRSLEALARRLVEEAR